MYSNKDFIDIVCSLKNKFYNFNSSSLHEDDIEQLPNNDKEFITKLNKLKKNHDDSVTKDLLNNLDFFDFIYSQKVEFEQCVNDVAFEVLYNKLKKDYNQKLDKENTTYEINNESFGKIDYPFKNLLLKGVPGTGKSKTIDNIVFDENKLDMAKIKDNILRINIHSASSNSDLMQGIAISTTNNNQNVLYKEKKGAILKHLFKAIYTPKQPFVLILEEIQENSLNELIGDLIYLIEESKRTVVDLAISNREIAYFELFEKIKEKYGNEDKQLHYVELPSLVENVEQNIKMIVPDNFYIFCTSNYRDDKKVIEDNLLRRFDVVEVYPKTKEELGQNKKGEDIFKSDDVSKFLEILNDSIFDKFKEETHPDRYLIGHANWINIGNENTEQNKKTFYKALLKVIIEFKEIREIEFKDYVKPILKNVAKDKNLPETIQEYLKIIFKEDTFQVNSYKEIVDLLQKEIYISFLS